MLHYSEWKKKAMKEMEINGLEEEIDYH